jgi:tetratricopeptide (TPR) repeat protein
VHVVLDWDWQIPAVTLIALASGVSLLAMGRSGRRPLRLRPVPRAAVIAPVVGLLAIALAAHVGNRAVGSAQADLAAGRPVAAAAAARRAHDWMPWAAQPWQLLGEARHAQREDAAARASLLQAVSADPAGWSAWYDLALVTSGRQHEKALRQARHLNPLAPELAGLR